MFTNLEGLAFSTVVSSTASVEFMSPSIALLHFVSGPELESKLPNVKPPLIYSFPGPEFDSKLPKVKLLFNASGTLK